MDQKRYAAPTIRELDPREVIRTLVAHLPKPIATVEDAADAIRETLERLPPEQRDDAVKLALGPETRWILRAAWQMAR
jgi:hypothetical protein